MEDHKEYISQQKMNEIKTQSRPIDFGDDADKILQKSRILFNHPSPCRVTHDITVSRLSRIVSCGANVVFSSVTDSREP